MQLPTITCQYLNKVEFFFMLNWNRFVNDLNIIADGPLFPEIIEAEYNPIRLQEVLEKWIEYPAYKFICLEFFEEHV